MSCKTKRMKTGFRQLAAALMCIFVPGIVATLPPIANSDDKPRPSAQELLDSAINTARAENKSIMIHFSASWCGWCKRLNAFLHASDTGKLIGDNYVLLELVVLENGNKKALETPGGETILKQMSGEEAGLPFYCFLNKDGKKICDSLVMPGGTNIGYPASREEIKAFERLLEKSAPRMTGEQRAQIVSYLTKTSPQL